MSMRYTKYCDAKENGERCRERYETTTSAPGWMSVELRPNGFEDARIDLCPKHAATLISQLDVVVKER